MELVPLFCLFREAERNTSVGGALTNETPRDLGCSPNHAGKCWLNESEVALQ